MSNLTHLFKKGQSVKVNLDGKFYDGSIKETFVDHIIIDCPKVSNHLYFDNDFLDMVYPLHNFMV